MKRHGNNLFNHFYEGYYQFVSGRCITIITIAHHQFLNVFFPPTDSNITSNHAAVYVI